MGILLLVGMVVGAPLPERLQCSISHPDLGRFPNLFAAEHTLLFAREHLAWVQAHGQDGCWTEWWFEGKYQETCWLELFNCHTTTGKLREEALERLRVVLGEQAWQAGQMPPPAPWWRFRRP